MDTKKEFQQLINVSELDAEDKKYGCYLLKIATNMSY
jgi:hypothetical protein